VGATTFSTMGLFATLSMNDTQNNKPGYRVLLYSVLRLLKGYAACRYAECRYTECRGALGWFSQNFIF